MNWNDVVDKIHDLAANEPKYNDEPDVPNMYQLKAACGYIDYFADISKPPDRVYAMNTGDIVFAWEDDERVVEIEIEGIGHAQMMEYDKLVNRFKWSDVTWHVSPKTLYEALEAIEAVWKLSRQGYGDDCNRMANIARQAMANYVDGYCKD